MLHSATADVPKEGATAGGRDRSNRQIGCYAAAAALEFLPKIANVEAHSGAADLKPASTSSAKRFFVAEETDAGEFHTWLWKGASLVSVV